MPRPLTAMSSALRSLRSSVLPLGSPTIAVPPPMMAIGVCPARCKWAMAIIGIKLPQ